MSRQAEAQLLAPAGQEIDDIVRSLNHICRVATLDLVFRVGECVIARLFTGDPARWERGGARHLSYRSLASHGDLALSPSALCRAVGIYVLVEQLGGRARWRHLTASHFQEVLPLNPSARSALLSEAEREQWSVARLRLEAAGLRENKTLPRRHVFDSLQRVRVSLTNQRQALAQLAAGPTAAELNELLKLVSTMRDELNEIENLVALRSEGPAMTTESDIRELTPVAPQTEGMRRPNGS